jgi:PIN domain nuclease of toxin-antitoxin system
MRRLLLDSNALLWWLAEDGPISAEVRAIVDDGFNEVAVSAASIWELWIKWSKGGVPLPADLLVRLDSFEVDVLDITGADGERAAKLPQHHRDPFDRMIVAHALAGGYEVVTTDRRFADYGVAVVPAR